MRIANSIQQSVAATVLALLIVSPAQAAHKGDALGPNQVLNGDSNDYISSRLVSFVMQSDCNLVAYHGTTARWNSGTHGKGSSCRAVMQGDGNLVVYRGGDNRAVWNSGTHRYPGGRLVAQYDGNVVIYQNGVARWATNTMIKYPSGGGGGQGSQGPFPGCTYARTDTKCVVVTQWHKEVYQCGWSSGLAPEEKSKGWQIAGACFGFDW